MPAEAPSFEAASLDLLRPTCGRHLDSIMPLLAPLPLTALDTLTLADLLELSDKARDEHLTVVLGWLFATLNEGSVCLKLDPLSIGETCHPEQAEASGKHLRAFIEGVNSGDYLGLVDDAGALSGAPLVRIKGQAASGRPDLLYFQRFYQHEARVTKCLERFLDGGTAALCDPQKIEALVADLWRPERVIRTGPERTPMTADPWQRAALGLMMKRSLTVISGGPGTGKTSLLVNMLRLLAACGVAADEISLTAPTGRAAQRMREAVQLYLPGIDAITETEQALLDIEAGTLHKLLRYQRHAQGFTYHAGHPLPARAVIVDEVSMIDVGMLDHLLQAIDPARTRLVFLGDKDQLPSVQAGAVFASLMPQAAAEASHDEVDEPKGGQNHPFRNHSVVLQTSYRSGKRLLALAAAVNGGRMPNVASLPMAAALEMPIDSFAIIDIESSGDRSGVGPGEDPGPILGHALCRWADHHYGSPSGNGGSQYLQLAAKVSASGDNTMGADGGRPLLGSLIEHLAKARILCVARHGPLGCVALNRQVMGHLARHHGLACDPGTGLFCGAPVLLTRNDYARQLFNGDVGVALWDQDGILRVYVQRGGSFINAPIKALTGWEPAFATTVHKSQGSEYENVLMVFPGDPSHRLLTREILYTGITRARERLLMVAGAQELKTALKNKIRRISGLTW